MSQTQEERNAHQRIYYDKNKGKIRAKYQLWYAKNKEKVNARSRAYHAAHPNPEKNRVRSLAYHYAHRKECNAKMRLYYKANEAKTRSYYQAHKEKIKTYSRLYRKQHNRCLVLKRYGLSETEFNVLFKRQGGVCAICGKPNWNSKGPCIDHDYITDKVRGILCFHCNIALGMIHDDSKTARAMVDYIEKSQEGELKCQGLKV